MSRRGWIGAIIAAVVLCAAAVLAYVVLSRPKVIDKTQIRALTEEVSVSPQIRIEDVPHLRDKGFRTIIDLRPDGEAKDQALEADVQNAAMKAGLGFSYVPVKHGAISRPSVKALASSLRLLPKPVLLYCASGRRSARTWALAEASKPGGLDAGGIESALADVGEPSPDLAAEIRARIAARGTSPGPTPIPRH